jgi:hypothetical protein
MKLVEQMAALMVDLKVVLWDEMLVALMAD